MAEDGVMELVLENGTIAMRGSNSSYSFRSDRDNITDAKGKSSSWLRNLDSFMGTDYDDKLNPGSIFPRSDFDFDMFCGNNINDKNNHLAETHVVPEYNKERNNWAATNNASRFVPEILAYPKPTRNCGNCSRNGKDSLQDQQGPSGYDRVMMDQPITTQPDDEQSEAVVPKATSFKNRTCPYLDQDHHGPKHANLPQNLVQRSVPTTSLCSREASNDLSSCLRSRYEDRSIDEIENSSDKHNDERGFTAKLRPLKRVGSKDRRKRSSNGHSLYEKRRRNKINKKMRALQELIPNSNKADKATTLDQAIEYLKTLQLQLQMMSSMGPGLCMPPFILSSPGMLQAPRFNVYSPMGFGMGMGMGGGVGGGGGGSGGQAYPLPTAMFGQMFPMFPAMNRGEGPFLGSVPFLNSTSSSDAVLHSIHSQMLKNETADNEIRKF